jgi:2,3-bisphosphoglycerate-independent phosphoglycerate mutase
MRRITLIIPQALALQEERSVLLQGLPNLIRMAELGIVERLAPMNPLGTPEAAWLGIDPARIELAQGPLVVGALGADPPPFSTQFHLSLLSVVEDKILVESRRLPAEQVRQVLEVGRRLETKSLKIVEGEGRDHGLVWENGSLDLFTRSPAEAAGKALRQCLPEGDGEPMLRQFIDDSVNLLSELELNQERVDQDLPPINLLWPWGHGFLRPVPNLLLKRGERVQVESASLRIEGLTRLAKLAHGNRHAFGHGVNTRWGYLRASVEMHEPVLCIVEAFAELRRIDRLEEGKWLVNEMDKLLLGPLLEEALLQPTRLSVLMPGGATDSSPAPADASPYGLALTVETPSIGSGTLPLDERSLEEARLPTRDAWQVVEESLRPVRLADQRAVKHNVQDF